MSIQGKEKVKGRGGRGQRRLRGKGRQLTSRQLSGEGEKAEGGLGRWKSKGEGLMGTPGTWVNRDMMHSRPVGTPDSSGCRAHLSHRRS